MLLLKILAAVLTVFAVLAIVCGPREAWRLWKRFGYVVGDFVGRTAAVLMGSTAPAP